MARSKRRRRQERDGTDELGFVRGGLHKKIYGNYRHVGEIYGESVCTRLRPWARDRVLAQVAR